MVTMCLHWSNLIQFTCYLSHLILIVWHLHVQE
jgi:hypothetical protein